MLLRERIRTPLWPYVAVVSCLFLLSVLASRSWQSQWLATRAVPIVLSDPALEAEAVMVSDPGIAETHEDISTVELPDTASVHTEAGMESPVAAPPRGSLAVPESHLAMPTDPVWALDQPRPAEESVAAPVPPDPPGLSAHQEPAQPLDHALVDLDPVFNMAHPRQEAVIAPAVGEQIKFDVSVKETPALPIDHVHPARPAAPIGPPIAPQPPALAMQPDGLERSMPQAVADVASVFPLPTDLLDRLRELETDPVCGRWANQVLGLFQRLREAPALSTPETKQWLDELGAQARAAYPLADKAGNMSRRAAVLRAAYATQRRADVWRQVQRIVATGQDVTPPVELANMAKPLAAVERRLAAANHAADWHQYLLLDEVRKLARGSDVEGRRRLAKRILRRIESPQLTEGQVDVFRNPPFDGFCRELHRWSAEPVDYLQLLDDIERYERTGQGADAIPIAHCYDNLRWSPHDEPRSLASLLNTHYRNSNVRVALSAELLNRLLPDPQQIEESVADNILGADVIGTSRAINSLRVVLVPDGNNWRIGLEAHGEVESDTAASKGPATFYNQGLARYYARKLLLVDRRGIRVWRAEAVADSETQLRGLETDYDALPIVGWLARNMARQQHDERYFEAKAETEAKLEDRATARFDQEVDQRLAQAEDQLNRRLIQPFERIELKPTPLDLRTTDQRVIARYRLAGDTQIGAHTPRPQAPGDSLMSVQVHESALNNTLANLKLEGKRTDLQTLYRELAATFDRPDLPVPDDMPEGVTIQFADQEAVRLKCDDDRVSLTLRFSELKSGRNRWRNFAVRAYYVADAEQLNANLVREPGGVIELMGEQVGRTIPLRIIFNKVLDDQRTFKLINDKLSENPRLRDSHVNQFVIDDGWIGIAIGPHYAGELEHTATQRKTPPRR